MRTLTSRRRISQFAAEGAMRWRVAFAIEVKQVAFTNLTTELRALRAKGVVLCDTITKWQNLKTGVTSVAGAAATSPKRKGSFLPTPGRASFSVPSGSSAGIAPSITAD